MQLAYLIYSIFILLYTFRNTNDGDYYGKTYPG